MAIGNPDLIQKDDLVDRLQPSWTTFTISLPMLFSSIVAVFAPLRESFFLPSNERIYHEIVWWSRAGGVPSGVLNHA
jgi:hypothetical protein